MPPRLSPDGRELLVGFRSLDGSGLAVYDLSRGRLAPVNQGQEAGAPV
jgi:hypothetical protein